MDRRLRVRLRYSHQSLDYPLLIRAGQFTTFDAKMPLAQGGESMAQARLRLIFLTTDSAKALEDRRVDLVLKGARDFFTRLEQGEEDGAPLRPVLDLQYARMTIARVSPAAA